MKVFCCNQIKEIDRFTIEQEPIASIDLMERAALGLMRFFAVNYSSEHPIFIFSGTGNNGVDGVALARLLVSIGYDVKLFILYADSYSDDNRINIDRLIEQGVINPIFIKSINDITNIPRNAIIVDALFGSGLTRPLLGLAAEVVNFINSSECLVVSIDIPSGLFGEENPFPNTNPVINANRTLTLQFPKLSFFFADNFRNVGQWNIIDIGLHPQAISKTDTPYYYIDNNLLRSVLKPRLKYSHKGNFGHCLIVAGSKGMMGAAVLCARSCLRAGAGLVTVHIPKVGYSILQQSVPEAIFQVDDNDNFFSNAPFSSKFTSIGIGPGLGKDEVSITGFRNLIREAKNPIVIDADGLNILASSPDLLELIPENSILTPHIGEFSRLFGEQSSGRKRLNVAIAMAAKYRIIIVVKGAHTRIVCPDGKVFFNSTGNPGMATAGSGDVLTGIISSLLGQGYSAVSACIIGVFLHGLAGDIAAKRFGESSLTATDITNCIGEAYLNMESANHNWK
jgi:NAD(P)H-hydrate epimerase